MEKLELAISLTKQLQTFALAKDRIENKGKYVDGESFFVKHLRDLSILLEEVKNEFENKA